jgi:hypothetical protein
MIYRNIKFHIYNFSGSSVIVINPIDIRRHQVAAMLLYTMQKIYIKKYWIVLERLIITQHFGTLQQVLLVSLKGPMRHAKQ